MIAAMRRPHSLIVIVVASVLFRAIGVSALEPAAVSAGQGYGTGGQLLVASPKMPDPRFAGTVIYMVDHNAEGALGLIINRPVGAGPLDKFLEGFGLEPPGGNEEILLHYGGPVEPDRLFVLHSSDWQSPRTLSIRGPLAVTAHPDVLAAMADGKGPRHSLAILGYAGWGPQQLEREIARDDWTTAPIDLELIFDDDAETKWERASAGAGITL